MSSGACDRHRNVIDRAQKGKSHSYVDHDPPTRSRPRIQLSQAGKGSTERAGQRTFHTGDTDLVLTSRIARLSPTACLCGLAFLIDSLSLEGWLFFWQLGA